MRRRLTLVAILTVSLAVVYSWASDVPRLPSKPTPGRFLVEIESGGYSRTAYIQIPKGYASDKPPALVIALHGGGGDGEHMLDENGWAAKADAQGFIVVAPNGLPAFPKLAANFHLNPAVWNSGQLPSKSPRTKIDDVAFIKRLLDELKTKVPYKTPQVFCTGHSNGGGMTFRLATEAPERFAAVATVTGQVAIDDPKPKKPLPTLYIYGEKDPLLPIDGGETKLLWGTRTTTPISTYLAKWAKALGCTSKPKTVSDQNGVKKVLYSSSSGGPSLTAIFITGQGHQWPGGESSLPERLVGPSTDQLDATDEIWEFFQKHPQP